MSDDGPVPDVLRVTFVCTGNICRSVIAEVVLRDALEQAGLGRDVHVDSAGTGDWHVGERADPRAVRALADVGLDGSRHRARQLDPREVGSADLLLALDVGHLGDLRRWAPDDVPDGRIRLLRGFDPAAAEGDLDVADPYYGTGVDFARVVRQVRSATPGLVDQLRRDVTRR